MLADHRDRLSSYFLAWSSIPQSVCQRAFSLLAIWCLRPWVRIPHSAELDNWSPFDSNTACLGQSIEIDNKHVQHQSQVRKPTGSRVEWAECLLTIWTGCRVQVLAWCSIAHSVCQRAFSLPAIWGLRPWVETCIQQKKATCLLSIRIPLACARALELTRTDLWNHDL